MEILGVILIVASLVSLMYLAYRGASVIMVAPLLAMVTIVLASNLNPITALYALTEQYMPALVSFVKSYFPLFLIGSIFGKIMGDSGAAKVVANTVSKIIGDKHAILIVVLATAILTYGGVSLFVVVFAIYPIAVELFRKGDVPKRLIAPAIALGGFTFTMTAMPGSPQSINAIPIKYLSTTIYAAPVLGILASAIMLGGGMVYLTSKQRKAAAASEGYGVHEDHIDSHATDAKLPSFALAVLPMLVVFIGNFFFTWFFKQESIMQAAFELYPKNATPAVTLATAANPIWAVTVSIFLATIVAIALYFKYLPAGLNKTLTAGTIGSLLPIFNTASENGYGGVIKTTGGFASLKTMVIALPMLPLFKMAIATTALAAVVGSSSAGTALALETFGDTFKTLMAENSIPPEVVHRVVLLAAGCLDSLPHCGAIITLLTVTHLTHKESYKDIAVNTIAIPIVAVVVVILFYTLTGIY